MDKMSKSEAGKLGNEKSSITQQKKKRERIKNYNENPTLCKNCNDPLDYSKRKNKFCSKSCAASFNNKKRKEYNSCEYCGENIEKPKKFCDNKCQQEKQYYDKVEKYISGNIKTLGNSFKRFLTERDGYKCSKCGISEWNGKKIVLEIEHIDGNSENNLESNLVFLCPNCHSQTDTYKGKNKGNGRHFRRERYKEGKSY